MLPEQGEELSQNHIDAYASRGDVERFVFYGDIFGGFPPPASILPARP
jgi:hypothetical protein